MVHVQGENVQLDTGDHRYYFQKLIFGKFVQYRYPTVRHFSITGIQEKDKHYREIGTFSMVYSLIMQNKDCICM